VLENQSNESIPVKKSNKLRNGIIGGGVIAAIAVGAGVIGISNFNNGEKPAEVPATSAPVDPTESAAPSEPEVQPTTPENSFNTEVGFSAEVYTTPESLIRAYVDANTQWINDGATAENRDLLYGMTTGLIPEEFANKIASETDQKYIDSIFSSDWESDIDVSGFINKTVANHESTLNLFYITGNYSGSNPEDVEPYRREANLISIESTTENSDGSWTIVTIQNEIDNDDKNRADELTQSSEVSEFETPVRVISTWTLQGGRWVISDLQGQAIG